MEWFKHKTASHDDPDIADGMDIFGDAAYMIFFITCEIYGDEFKHLDDGWLNVSQTFMRRKLRKTWTKVEKVLNFYQTRKRFIFITEDGRVKIKIPNFIDLASNWSKRKPKPPTEAPTTPPTAIDLEVELDLEIDKDKRKNIKKEKPSWRDNYLIYKQMVLEAFINLQKDPHELLKQQSYNSNLDITKTLDKAVHNYWGTEKGWKKKKSQKSKKIDMRTTLINALSIDMNKVWKPRGAQDEEAHDHPEI